MIKLIAGGSGVGGGGEQGWPLLGKSGTFQTVSSSFTKVHFIDKGSRKEETRRRLLSQIVNI